MNRIFFLFILTSLFSTIFAETIDIPAEKNKLIVNINTGFHPPISDILDKLSEEAFNQIGMKTKFQLLPAERSVKLVAQGIDDAECCRIVKIMEQYYPELIPVNESLYDVTFSAFVKDPTIKIAHWNDLQPYNVGVVKGYKITVVKAKEVNPEKLIILDNANSMMNMLDLGRIDIAILGFEDGLDIIQKLGIKGIKVQEPPLLQKPLHIMLNNKHKHLSKPLEISIKQMKKEGTLKDLTDKILNQY